MGRYAYFKTDDGDSIEYRFAFGQCTDDITEFEGQPYRNLNDVDFEYVVDEAENNLDIEAVQHLKDELDELREYMDDEGNVYNIEQLKGNYWLNLGRTGHRWFHTDLPDILKLLETEAEEINAPIPNWSSFKPDEYGVDKLMDWLDLKCNPDTDTLNAHYTLGCIIYLLLSNQPEDKPLGVLYDH